MKKIIAVVLCLVMVFSLCACSVQGIPKDGTKLLELLKQVLSSFDFGKVAEVPEAVPSQIVAGEVEVFTAG